MYGLQNVFESTVAFSPKSASSPFPPPVHSLNFLEPSIRRQVGRYLKIFIHSLGDGRSIGVQCLIAWQGNWLTFFLLVCENKYGLLIL